MIVSAGDEFNIEKDLNIKVLWPYDNKFINDNILNNNSLVFKLCYNDFSALFTGDIENVAEEQIINNINNSVLESVLIKAAHHGSKTSSMEQFIEKVNPKIALIGVGKDNKFGHPSNTVIQRLNKRNIKVFRTDINGEICIYINKKSEINITTKIK